MWSQSKSSNEVSMEAGASNEVSAFIGRGVEFKGTITYNGIVRIDGALDGEIQTQGELVIGEEAVVTAKVMAGVVVCKGKVTGDIVATEKVKLLSPAVVTASVKAPVISIEEGVTLNGNLEMEPSGHKPQRESNVHALGAGSASIKRVS